MKKYFIVFRNAVGQMMQYRLRQIIWIFSEISSLLFMPFVWLSVYQGHDVVAGMTRNDIITYFLLVSVVSMLTTTFFSRRVADTIYQGRLPGFLVKPYSYTIQTIVHETGTRSPYTVFGLLVFFFGHWFFPQYILLPHTVFSFIWFLFFLLIARILCILSEVIVGYLAFWFEQIWGFRSVRWLLDSLAGGRFVPISFFSLGVQRIVYALPFAYMLGIPVEVYLGKVHGTELYLKALLGLGWVAVFCGLVALMWYRGLKRYNGGGM